MGGEGRQKLPVPVFPPLRNGVHKCERGKKKKKYTRRREGWVPRPEKVEMREREASSDKAASERTCKYMREAK